MGIANIIIKNGVTKSNIEYGILKVDTIQIVNMHRDGKVVVEALANVSAYKDAETLKNGFAPIHGAEKSIVLRNLQDAEEFPAAAAFFLSAVAEAEGGTVSQIELPEPIPAPVEPEPVNEPEEPGSFDPETTQVGE